MAIYNPPLRTYAPFYIQWVNSLQGAIDIRSRYGVTILVHEYPAKMAPKDVYTIDWKERNGDDEYGPSGWKAISLKLKCVIFSNADDKNTAREEIRDAVRTFREALSLERGFWIYDDWTKHGFKKVRLEEFQEIGEGDFRVFDGMCRLIFTVTLKVNDPISRIRYRASDNTLINLDPDPSEED